MSGFAVSLSKKLVSAGLELEAFLNQRGAFRYAKHLASLLWPETKTPVDTVHGKASADDQKRVEYLMTALNKRLGVLL